MFTIFIRKKPIIEQVLIKRTDGTLLRKPMLRENSIGHNPKCICRKCIKLRK